MRELTLNEMEVISGTGTGTDAAKGVGESMTAWGAAGAIIGGGARGSMAGARVGGMWGVAVGFVAGAAGAAYDLYKDGSDYADGTNY